MADINLSDIKHEPVQYRYMRRLYNSLLKSAKETKPVDLIEFGYPAHATESVMVFTGYIQDAGTSTGMAKSATTNAMSRLNAMQATTALRTSGGRLTSVYLLNYMPTLEQYEEYKKSAGITSRRIAPSTVDILSAQVKELRHLVQDLRIRLENLERGSTE